MVQLRPRASRAPASAEAMVDEGQPASEEEEAEHGLLLGQPSSGAAAEPLEEDEEGDDEFDDEAPEELTFASAQAEAREEERRVRETVTAPSRPEKRKRREELFIEQKKRKLLPDTILEKLTTASQTLNVKKSPGKVKEVNLQKKNEDCEKGNDSKKVKVQKVQSVSQNKSYLAVRLKDQDLRDSRQQAAQAFIHNSLYGPGTNRTTVNKFLSLANKRSPVKKAAVQFLNNAWGIQKKQNAKRFKRRWMVRKMKTKK
uniref:Nucleolar protein 7 n=1 Tax=Macaca mulatta TaxID=9544 RepID=F7EZ59_MACMU